MAVKSRMSTEDRIIAQFRQAETPFLTAVEIADAIGMTRQGVNQRLKQLEERDIVERKKVGSRAVAWWLAGEN
jgi:predicted transcriptional regulator